MGFRRQPAARWASGPVVGQCRIRAEGARRRGLSTASRSALLQHLLPVDEPAGGRARCETGGAHAGDPETRLLRKLRLGGQRFGREDRSLLLEPVRPPRQEDHHRPAPWLPRRHAGGGELVGTCLYASPGRPAATGIRACRGTLLVRPRGRHGPRRVRSLRRQGTGGQDSRARPRPGRGLHRRTDPGCGWRNRAARELLAGGPAHLHRVRCAADRGRGDLRLWANRCSSAARRWALRRT